MRLSGKHVPPRGRDRQEALDKFDAEAAWSQWSARTLDDTRARQQRRRWMWRVLIVMLLIALMSVTAGMVP